MADLGQFVGGSATASGKYHAVHWDLVLPRACIYRPLIGQQGQPLSP